MPVKNIADEWFYLIISAWWLINLFKIYTDETTGYTSHAPS